MGMKSGVESVGSVGLLLFVVGHLLDSLLSALFLIVSDNAPSNISRVKALVSIMS
jgi:hypothetical protein